MKILITGVQGQLGKELMKQLKELKEKYEVIGTTRETLDITDKEKIDVYMEDLKPDIIVNCAAYTAVDAAEEQESIAYAVNVQGPKYLAQACEKLGAKLIYISTDYVFDGNEVAYKNEEDGVNPQNVYGQTKYEGEEAVRTYCTRHFILRTAWLYGEGHNFVRTMLQLAQKNQEINVVADQFGTPTSTKDLARVILALMQTEAYGTYHATCEGACSWYELACEIFKLKELDVKVNPVTSETFARPAKRPFYSVLENANLKQLGLNTFRPWQEALADYLESDTVWQQENLGGQANG